MAILTNGTWVLVADGEKALFLRNDVDAENPDREQSANRPGRMKDGGPGQKSAYDDTDWHELAKERFADELADLLYQQAHKGAFERIVLVAPPATLGELRSKLHKEVADKVVAEIDKTLTNHPIDKIESLLHDALESA